MKPFAVIYCAKHRSDPATFARRLFWHGFHRSALAVTALVLVAFPRLFNPDWAQIHAAGRSYSLCQVDEEIRQFVLISVNFNWPRVGEVRVSAQRIRRVARHAFVSSREQLLHSGGSLIQ